MFDGLKSGQTRRREAGKNETSDDGREASLLAERVDESRCCRKESVHLKRHQNLTDEMKEENRLTSDHRSLTSTCRTSSELTYASLDSQQSNHPSKSESEMHAKRRKSAIEREIDKRRGWPSW